MKYSPSSASSYTELPVRKIPSRIRKVAKNFAKQLSLKGTEFPVSGKNYSNIETKEILVLMSLSIKI